MSGPGGSAAGQALPHVGHHYLHHPGFAPPSTAGVGAPLGVVGVPNPMAMLLLQQPQLMQPGYAPMASPYGMFGCANGLLPYPAMSMPVSTPYEYPPAPVYAPHGLATLVPAGGPFPPPAHAATAKFRAAHALPRHFAATRESSPSDASSFGPPVRDAPHPHRQQRRRRRRRRQPSPKPSPVRGGGGGSVHQLDLTLDCSTSPSPSDLSEDDTAASSGRSSQVWDDSIEHQSLPAADPHRSPPDAGSDVDARAELRWRPPAAGRQAAEMAVLVDECGSNRPDLGHSRELVLWTLLEAGYDAAAARRRLAFCPINCLERRTAGTWTHGQVLCFEKGFRRFGKQFHRIAALVANKTRSDCVDFYYRWKKTERAEGDLDRQSSPSKPRYLGSPSKGRPSRVAASEGVAAAVIASYGNGGSSGRASSEDDEEYAPPSRQAPHKRKRRRVGVGKASGAGPAKGGRKGDSAGKVRRGHAVRRQPIKAAEALPPEPAPARPGATAKRSPSGSSLVPGKGKGHGKARNGTAASNGSSNGPAGGSSPHASDSSEIFLVEEIIRHRRNRGHREFLVRWEGYADNENTWEPAANLSNNVVFKEYCKRHGLDKKRTPAAGQQQSQQQAKKGNRPRPPAVLELPAAKATTSGSESERSSHRRRRHQEVGNLAPMTTCPLCPWFNSDADGMNLHVRTEHPVSHLSCHHQGSFESISEFISHLFTAHVPPSDVPPRQPSVPLDLGAADLALQHELCQPADGDQRPEQGPPIKRARLDSSPPAAANPAVEPDDSPIDLSEPELDEGSVSQPTGTATTAALPAAAETVAVPFRPARQVSARGPSPGVSSDSDVCLL